MFTNSPLYGARIPEPLPEIRLGVSPNSENATEKLFILAQQNEKVKDYVKAFHLYYAAAIIGHIPSMFYVGKCWEKGRGMPKFVNQALYWYKHASLLGHKEARYRLELISIRLLLGKENLPSLAGSGFNVKDLVGIPKGKEESIMTALPAEEKAILEKIQEEKQIRLILRAQSLYA